MNGIKIAIAQMNATVGAIAANRDKMIVMIQDAVRGGADMVVFPELSIPGYPPMDLIYEPGFIEKNIAAMENLLPYSKKIIILAGFINRCGKALTNSIAVLQNEQVHTVVDKSLLPTYDVFDEHRYFTSAKDVHPVKLIIRGEIIHIGIEICEDLWDENYPLKVTDELVQKGAEIIINCSASPYSDQKLSTRHFLVRKKVNKLHVPFLYVNQIGAQDELIFDGNSFGMDHSGKLIHCSAGFKESLDLVQPFANVSSIQRSVNILEEMHNALILGIHDYFYKSGFTQAVLGLSGGIDSALVAALAADALGAENVFGYSLPSRFSSDHSLADAKLLADNLGIHYSIIPIEPTVKALETSLKNIFAGTESGLAEENIQARARGNILMAIANKFNRLVLTTGNKTELALGYCTLYGDMAGGLSPISDLNKMDVYALSNFINDRAGLDRIPKNTLLKKPSAELKVDQYDPFDYEIVSPLVEEILENHRDDKALILMGYQEDLIRDLKRLIRVSEYKRRQAPPGLRVTEKTFGSGRRMPIVNHYRE